MWSKQNRMENSSHSDLSPPSLICALDVGDPERAATPFRVTCLRCGEVGDKGGRRPASGPGREGAAWGWAWLVCYANADSDLPPHP